MRNGIAGRAITIYGNAHTAARSGLALGARATASCPDVDIREKRRHDTVANGGIMLRSTRHICRYAAAKIFLMAQEVVRLDAAGHSNGGGSHGHRPASRRRVTSFSPRREDRPT